MEPQKLFDTAKKARYVLRALDNPFRQKLLALLAEKGTQSVTALYVALRWEQSIVSQHLAILRKQRLVTTARKGKVIEYTLNQARLDSLGETAKQLLK